MRLTTEPANLSNAERCIYIRTYKITTLVSEQSPPYEAEMTDRHKTWLKFTFKKYRLQTERHVLFLLSEETGLV